MQNLLGITASSFDCNRYKKTGRTLDGLEVGLGIENRFRLRSVPTDQFHQNCTPPTLSILLNNSLISLPAQGFLVFLKFCVMVHLRHAQLRGSIMERRKRSEVWLHFTKQDENSAVCNQCNAVISCKGANTSNMLKHLSPQHGIKYQECHVPDRLRTSAKLALSKHSYAGKVSRCCSVCFELNMFMFTVLCRHHFGKK